VDCLDELLHVRLVQVLLFPKERHPGSEGPKKKMSQKRSRARWGKIQVKQIDGVQDARR
jgi:hypothetical protein